MQATRRWAALVPQRQISSVGYNSALIRRQSAVAGTPTCHGRTHRIGLYSRCWQRSFSSSSDGRTTHARSQALAAHFVPFSIGLPKAQEAYLSWARKQILAPPSLQSLKAICDTDQVYLPFFVFDISVISRFGGRVGHRVSQTVWNPKQRIWESHTVINWRQVPLEMNGTTAAYSSDRPQMQIYSAFKHKWQPIQVIKNPLTGRLRTPAQMSPADFSGKEIDVAEMKVETAQGRVLEYVRQQEQERGAQHLRLKYGADEVDVEAEVRILSFNLRRVYQPAIIFHLEHMNERFEVLVNGVTGAVSGQYHYSASKAALAVAAPMSAVWGWLTFAAHAVPPNILTYAAMVVAPTVVAAVAARYWATTREYFREIRRRQDRENDARLRPGTYAGEQWNYQQRTDSAGQGEHQRQEQRYEQRYEQASQRQQQQQYQPPPRPKATPTQSHYAVLGISKSASLEDIRTAFRAKSFQHHPDVNKGSEKDANDKFRQILEAYQILRDPAKRAAYDRTL